MPARLLDGVAVAAAIVEELKPRVEAFRARRGRPPALGIVLVGHDPASEIYVRNKMRTGAGAGVAVRLERLP
ncbi:MAG TPA: tetrahydrofolate dehydrogenase/cyclohydrolase catalytic domain-containing protein, partial [Vicinamibacterales bacterium]|nr:tetrahydrofolate dehydrogenase/cyclohydrolase catalytic domain-containing protein [Vicinamibacterales bacterium]